MKKNILIMISSVLVIGVFSGCSMLTGAVDYAKERKVIICTGMSEGKCLPPFSELDATDIPIVGDTSSIVANRILTCAYYGKNDINCSENLDKFTIDLIK